MKKSAFFAVVMALAFTAAPVFAQLVNPPVVVTTPAAGAPVVAVAAEPVMVAADLEIVVEPKTWLDWIQEAAYALLRLFGAGAAGAALLFILKLLPGLTKSLADSDRARIQEIILNGLYWAVGRLGHGADPRQVKNATVDYTRMHAVEYYKRLGVDIAADSTKEAIIAQADRMLNDPAVPTPPSVTPANGKPAVSAVISPSSLGGQ